MEVSLLNAIVVIATGSAVIKFALFELEGVIHACSRIRQQKRPKRYARRRKAPTGMRAND
jgi:hypothetical protein